MKRSTIAIAVLSVLLVLSNAYWLFSLFDAGVSYMYLQDSHRNARATALQSLALLPEVARPGATRNGIIEAAVRASSGSEPFEKDGYVWVGDVGLQFDPSGALVGARAAVEPF